MERWNGDRGPFWSHRQEIGSNVSSSPGTIASRLSTAYTSSGSGFSMEVVAMHFNSLGIHEEHDGNNIDSKTWGCLWWEEAEQEEEEKRMNRIRLITQKEREMESMSRLVEEFFTSPSANRSIKGGDMGVLERWFGELGVAWILHLADGTSAGQELIHRDARSGIRALDQIAQSICLVRPLFPDRDSDGLPSICEEEGEHVAGGCIPDQYHLVLFFQETMLKILAFVDVVIVAWDPNKTEEFLPMDRVMPPPYNKLKSLLRVHRALSGASYKILKQFKFNGSTSVQVKRIEKEMTILLLAYKSKLGEAIWSTMEKIRTKSMEDGDDSSSPQGSSDIHKVTRSVMTYISFLCFCSSYSLVDEAIFDKYVSAIKNERPLHGMIREYVSAIRNEPPLHGMIIEMVSCLQEKLASISESFPDQGLRFLFLLNNLYSIEEQLHPYSYSYSDSLHRFVAPDVDLTDKIEAYMERYLQVSWAPLLSCLFNPTPLCLGKIYSPLSKFESEFQKIYTTQKHWKVPDPELRRRLREVIIDNIIPSYTEYIEGNKVTNPKISPQELKTMLQELFEG